MTNVSKQYWNVIFLTGGMVVEVVSSTIFFPYLDELYLLENHFSGSIPPSICNMVNLAILSLRSNRFFREFRHAWMEEGNIKVVDVANNNLSAVQQHFLRKNPSFLFLSFLFVPILGSFVVVLMSIDLGGIRLTGSVPLLVYATIVIQHFKRTSSSANVLPSLPSYSRPWSQQFFQDHSQVLENMTSLGILNLSMNQLSGKIHSNIDSSKFVFSNLLVTFELVLYQPGQKNLGNQLQTLIDPSIYRGNPLLCGVPLAKCPGDDSAPTFPSDGEEGNEDGNNEDVLWFYGFCGTLLVKNLRSGHIPRHLCNLPYLHILDLGHNNLSGTIPKCLKNLTTLTFFPSNNYVLPGYDGMQTTVAAKGSGNS
ncbi:hypothetical protein DVH24_021995 [Malus domestica]|uniref:Uncharacterized protein n=1 Tax=Malus domestica TaxID=3750 RepID=A0A498IYE5_MALDO|nr:hypothetical protein DVH24_021995 [Malus domestica]